MSTAQHTIGYARVSTDEQNVDMQVSALIRAGVPETHIFTEKLSGVATKRPKRALAAKACRKGSTFVVWKLDRVGRSLLDLLEFIQALEKRGVYFRSLQDAIDTSTPAGRMMLAVAGAFAQFERDIIAERTRAGVHRAMERGVKFGRAAKITEPVRAKFEAMIAENVSVDVAAKRLKIAPSTFRAKYRRPDLDALRDGTIKPFEVPAK